MLNELERPVARRLIARLREPRRHFIQILLGPRQVGKTTAARQARTAFPGPSHFASADVPGMTDASFIEQHWEVARAHLASGGAPGQTALLLLDEVQKVPGWPETVKRLWDEDTAAGRDLRVVLLGSSPLLLQAGLTESLAGRFELLRCTHWTFAEMADAFGLDLDRYLFLGGYPGGVSLAATPPSAYEPSDDPDHRWRRYLLDALIETTLSRDILLMTRIDKPALLRRVFALGCEYSGQILSYQKMQGQLQDAGNTTTLAHYLAILGAAGLVAGLEKYAGERVRQRASSPKLQALNTALVTAMSGRTADEIRTDREYRGRLVETAVGAHLVNGLAETEARVEYWREGDAEVDFVVTRRDTRLLIEVKSGRLKRAPSGLAAFESAHGPARKLLIGGGGLEIETFLRMDVRGLL
ncbi:ATP-binding protein [Myxococcota bacterium]|nr:ATP-binding protein [Myxococcota bacterium]